MLTFVVFVLGLVSTSGSAAVPASRDLCERNLRSGYEAAAEAANATVERIFDREFRPLPEEASFFSPRSFVKAGINYENETRRGYAFKGVSRRFVRDGRVVVLRARAQSSCELATGIFDRAYSSVTASGLRPEPPTPSEPGPCVPTEYTTCDPPVDCSRYDCP